MSRSEDDPRFMKYMIESMKRQQVKMTYREDPYLLNVPISKRDLYNELHIRRPHEYKLNGRLIMSSNNDMYYTMKKPWEVTRDDIINHQLVDDEFSFCYVEIVNDQIPDDKIIFPVMFKLPYQEDSNFPSLDEQVSIISDFMTDYLKDKVEPHLIDRLKCYVIKGECIMLYPFISMTKEELILLTVEIRKLTYINTAYLYHTHYAFISEQLMLYDGTGKSKQFPEHLIEYLSIECKKRRLIRYGTRWQLQDSRDQDIEFKNGGKEDHFISLRDRMNTISGSHINQMLIPDLAQNTSYCIKSCTGTGKTEAVMRLTKNKNTLWIVYRRSQAHELSLKTGIMHYLQGEIFTDGKSSYIISIQSLHKLKDHIKNLYFDYVIIDECESVLRSLFESASEKHMVLNNFMLNHLLINTPNYIVMDAELTQNTINIIHDLSMNNPPQVIINDYKRERDVVIIDDLESRVIDDLKNGLKVAIACGIKIYARRLYETVTKQGFKNISLYTSEDKIGIGENLNVDVLQMNCFIFTSVMESAISITCSHFDHVYAYCDIYGTSSSGLMQMLGRIRNFKKMFIHKGLGTNPEKWKVNLHHEITESNIGWRVNQRTNNNPLIGRDQLQGNPPQYVIDRLTHEQHRNDLDSHGKFDMLCFKLKQDGCIFVDDTLPKIEEKVVLENVQIVSLSDIKSITYEQKVEIECLQIKGEVNSDQRIQLDKYYHDEIIKIEEIVNVPENMSETECESLFVKVQDKVFDMFRKKDFKPLIDHKMLRVNPDKFRDKIKRLGDRNIAFMTDRWSDTLTMNDLSVKLGVNHLFDTETIIKRGTIMKPDVKELIISMSKRYNFKAPVSEKDYIMNLRLIIGRHTKIMSMERVGRNDQKIENFKLRPKDLTLNHVNLWEIIK